MNVLKRGMGLVLGTALLTAIGAQSAAAAGPKYRVLTLLVKQDFSDCGNSDIPQQPSRALVGGEAEVTRRGDGTTTVNVRLVNAAPNTSYQLFLKCVYQLGNIQTNASGRGNNTFSFPTNATGNVFAFDMYPAGAPAGNKYQSIQVSFQ